MDNQSQAPIAPMAQQVPPSKMPPPGFIPKSPVKKKKARGSGLVSSLTGGMINKDTILLGVILILILTILGMAFFVMQAMTNPGVSVSFETPAKTSSGSTLESDPVETQPIASDLGVDKWVDAEIFLIAYKVDNPSLRENNLPAGSEEIDLGGIVDGYLVPVPLQIEAKGELTEISTTLQAMFDQNDVVFSGISLNNSLSLSSIEVKVTKTTSGVFQVDLQGTLLAAGDLSYLYMKAQIENTIEQFTNKYEVLLNGSKDDYESYGDLRG